MLRGGAISALLARPFRCFLVGAGTTTPANTALVCGVGDFEAANPNLEDYFVFNMLLDADRHAEHSLLGNIVPLLARRRV